MFKMTQKKKSFETARHRWMGTLIKHNEKVVREMSMRLSISNYVDAGMPL